MCRAHRRILPLGFILILMVAACRPSPTAAPPPAIVVVSGASDSVILAEVVKVVEMRPSENVAFAPVGAGQKAKAGAQVRTGDDSTARLDLASGGFIRLAPNTQITVVTLPAAQSEPLIRLRLATGKLWISLKGGGIEVETPFSVEAVRGSFAEFEYWPGASDNPAGNVTVVRCLEGVCGVQAPDTTLMILGNLELVTLTTNGQPPSRAVLGPEAVNEFIQNNPESAALSVTLTAAVPGQAASAIPTRTATRSATPSSTRSATRRPTATPTLAVYISSTATRTRTATATATSSVTSTSTVTWTSTITPTPTATGTRTLTFTPSVTSAFTATRSPTPSTTSTSQSTHTSTAAVTVTPTSTDTHTPTVADTPTATPTPAPSSTETATPTDTVAPTDTPTVTPT